MLMQGRILRPRGETWRHLVGLVTALLLALLSPGSTSAATLNDPLQQGDLFLVNNNLNSLSQIRAGARIGGAVGYGTGTGNERLGGIFTDQTGALYLAGQPGGLTSGTTVVERIGIGETNSTQVLGPADLAGGSALREDTVAPSGNIYALYTTG